MKIKLYGTGSGLSPDPLLAKNGGMMEQKDVPFQVWNISEEADGFFKDGQ